jgi:hypothetical protein
MVVRKFIKLTFTKYAMRECEYILFYFTREIMNNLSSLVNSNNNLEWRRSKVQELSSQGYNQSEISRILQISQPTINRDITFLRQQAKPPTKILNDDLYKLWLWLWSFYPAPTIGTILR